MRGPVPSAQGLGDVGAFCLGMCPRWARSRGGVSEREMVDTREEAGRRADTGTSAIGARSEECAGAFCLGMCPRWARSRSRGGVSEREMVDTREEAGCGTKAPRRKAWMMRGWIMCMCVGVCAGWARSRGGVQVVERDGQIIGRHAAHGI